VADVISVRVKLLVVAGKWQDSGKTPAAVVFSVMAVVIPVLDKLRHYALTKPSTLTKLAQPSYSCKRQAVKSFALCCRIASSVSKQLFYRLRFTGIV
jgi:hypothetical protein